MPEPAAAAGPLLVYGPRSLTYDFGPGHPLTPRRFGPGIDLLRAVGAEPGLAPEPAADADLLACHTARYIAAVRRFSDAPWGPPEAGIGPGDDPAFAGMHEAAAAVAGGSLRAVEAILGGEVRHAHHPGGGLHHAMPGRASGFCVYDDPALAIARARRDGLRVLYVDLDVHHGDGVQAIHEADPGVLTFSIHESGRYLFPGTGFVGELGTGDAAGTCVNLPLEPPTGETAWLAAVRQLVPELAAAFGPDLVVSQHGADSHAWDPLAHLRVTTTAMGAAARIVDAVAHRWAGGRWLATGGGGYDADRVVPRAWALTWLAGAHREPPPAIPEAWRARWAADAIEHGRSPLPTAFDDPPNAGLAFDAEQAVAERASVATTGLVRTLVVPALIREAADRGWWARSVAGTAEPADRAAWPTARPLEHDPAIVRMTRAVWPRLTLAPRVIPPVDPAAAHGLVAAALADPGVAVVAALDGTVVVGLALAAPDPDDPFVRRVMALGVAPAARRRGVAGRLLEALIGGQRPGDNPWSARVTVAERDPYEPLDRSVRAKIGRRLLERAGFEVRSAPGPIGSADPMAIEAARGG